MKIVVLLETYDVGGPARNLIETLCILKDRANFTVGTFLRRPMSTSPFVQFVRDRGLDIFCLEERFRYDPGGLVSLARRIRREAPDLIQIHNTKSRLYGLLLRAGPPFRSIPQVHYFHGETWVDRKQLFYNRVDRVLLKRSPAIFVVSESQRTLLSSWGVPPDRIHVVYNAIRLQPADYKPPRPPYELLSVGRMTREKGHLTLLQVVAGLVERGVTDFVLRLVGDGPERDRLERYAEERGITGLVKFEGYRDRVEPYYRRADLFVLPSFTEGFPNVLLEAGMWMTPIITFGVGGVPEIFEAGTEAVILPPGDPGAMEEAVLAFLNGPEGYTSMAFAARRRVERDFSMEAKAEKLLACYETLLRERETKGTE